MRVRVLLVFAVVLAVASAADDKDGESAPDPPADDDKGESAGGDNSCQYASDGVCDEEGHPNCGKTPDGRDAYDCGYATGACDAGTDAGDCSGASQVSPLLAYSYEGNSSKIEEEDVFGLFFGALADGLEDLGVPTKRTCGPRARADAGCRSSRGWAAAASPSSRTTRWRATASRPPPGAPRSTGSCATRGVICKSTKLSVYMLQ